MQFIEVPIIAYNDPCKYFNYLRPIYDIDRLGHDMRYAINFSKLQDQLSWTPRFDFKKSLLSTVEWYLANY